MTSISKQLFSSIANNLNAAMDQLKFDGSLTFSQVESIKTNLYQAKAAISTASDVHPLSDELALFSGMTDVLEKALNVADTTKHLI